MIPSYDAANGTCIVYCHGATFPKPRVPSWTAKPAGCDLCHDIAAHKKGGADCSTCHQQTVRSCAPGSADCLEVAPQVGLRFIAKSSHIDGRAPVGRIPGEVTCHSCHGTLKSGGAPAPDLHGNSSSNNVVPYAMPFDQTWHCSLVAGRR